MRKSKVLISMVAVLCAFGVAKEKEAEAKFSLFKKQEEKPKVQSNVLSKPQAAPAVQNVAVPNHVVKKPAVNAAALTGASMNQAAKPQVGQVGRADIPQLDTPRGDHIDKEKFRGAADHANMRDHIPGVGEGGVHVAGKDGEDAFTGRGES